MGEKIKRERDRETVMLEMAMEKRKEIIQRRLKAQEYGNQKSKKNMKRRSCGGRVNDEPSNFLKENNCINTPIANLRRRSRRRSLGNPLSSKK
mmetsp:Transcript_18401/g.23189  ORF Transcript_18401/g.23189 Transcript_18401/m.23189 type:complete len:93 (+) Transcript_18401:531-809(+)